MSKAVAAALVLVLAATSIIVGGEGIQSAFDPATLRPSPSHTLRATQPPEAAGVRSSSNPAPAPAAREDRRADREVLSPRNADLVGDFCYPDNVPYYGVSFKREVGNDLIRVLEATVRTRATSETDLTLLTRALKAFYADHDALVLSFESLAGEDGTKIGEAYVTNTAAGAFILGMSGGPLNEEGISVVSYTDPATIPQAEVFARTECS